MSAFLKVETTPDVLTLDVYAQPGAKLTCIAGQHDGALKIRVHAPPVDGKANKELADFLSELFDLPKRNIELLKGQTSRNKIFRIRGVALANALAKINDHMVP